MKSVGIPIPTLRRLPLYYQQLLSAYERGEEFISSVELGEATGCAAEQVRKDLSFLAGQGKSRVGYRTKKLAGIIEDYLGMEMEKRAILVGVGNLGRAIALYPGFSQYGLSIVGIFDNDPGLFGQSVGSLSIQPITELPEFICENNIKVAIITTPPKAAQSVATEITKCGIRAIWNFSMAHLHVPKEVMVRNVDLSLELAVISHYINHIQISEKNKQTLEN